MSLMSFVDFEQVNVNRVITLFKRVGTLLCTIYLKNNLTKKKNSFNATYLRPWISMKLVDMVPVITILRTKNIPSLYITS